MNEKKEKHEDARRLDPWWRDKIPPQASVEENEDYFDRLVAGDETVREPMVRGNMALGMKVVHDYLKVNWMAACYRDDMVAGVMSKLVTVVGDIHKIKRHCITGYIYECLKNVLEDVLADEQKIRVPRSSRDDAKRAAEVARASAAVAEALSAVLAAGSVLAVAAAELATATAAAAKAREIKDEQFESVDNHWGHEDKGANKTREMDFRELIDLCCVSDIDRQIISMREERHTDKYIMKETGLSRRRFKTRIKELEERIVNKYRWDYFEK